METIKILGFVLKILHVIAADKFEYDFRDIIERLVPTEVILQTLSSSTVTSCYMQCKNTPDCLDVGLSPDLMSKSRGLCYLLRSGFNGVSTAGTKMSLLDDPECCAVRESCFKNNFRCCKRGYVGNLCTSRADFSLHFVFKTASISRPWKRMFPIKALTIAFWIKGALNTTNQTNIVTMSFVNQTYNEISVQYNEGGMLRIQCSFLSDIQTDVPITEPHWSHFAIVLSKTALKVYKNGLLEDTVNLVVTFPDPTAGDVYLGSSCFERGNVTSTATTNSNGFQGQLVHFYVWSRALKDSDVKDVQDVRIDFKGSLQIWGKFRHNTGTGVHIEDYPFNY
ncbi:uncharacterized protein LOC130630323 [Hydractinia symbiolongicarpus]|uniref:uncharacterized protein LOC130630323 n=1 Tax=Hydractinia symbiolongicarpus TaxID=13093 RepID=UPI00254FB140|nr:uncharacterized protein LOC130630323 [Hydractinia symbiolongicarpus]